MKILINGLGSIGCRHIKNLKAKGFRKIAGFDKSRIIANSAAKKFNIDIVNSYYQSIKDFDVIFICNPPSNHVPDTLAALKLNKYVFLEKPISNKLAEARKLIKKKNIMVGFNMRFHPMIIFLKKFIKKIGIIYNVQVEYGYDLLKARKNKNFNKGYYSTKNDGGVILDHIHELDYLELIFGRFVTIFCSAKKISNLKIKSFDNANLIMKNKLGFDLTLHLDYLQKKYKRSLKVITSEGILECDFSKNKLLFLKNNGSSFNKKFYDNFDETYIKEIDKFFYTIKNNKNFYPTVADCFRSSYLADRAYKSIISKKIIKL